MNISGLLAVFLCFFAFVAPSRGEEQIADVFVDPAFNMKRADGRARAVARIKMLEDARAVRTRAKAKTLGLQMRSVTPRGGVREIVDFEGDQPIYLTTRNLNAAISTSANLVQAAPYLLDGSGIIAGVWDAGSVRATHQEFATGNRVTILDGAAADGHATHVGGTIGSRGVTANSKGMAPNIFVHSYDWNSDTSEMTSRAATAPNQFADKIYLSNHSYGYSDGWDGNQWLGTGTDQNATDTDFGQYDTISRTLDGVMYNAPYYIAFWAAGNDGNDNPSTGSNVVIGGATVAYNPAIHPPGDSVYRNGFETIAAHGIAKNLITIGAANDAVTSGTRDPSKSTLTSFSSTGPCDDGRIKPDLVANGASLVSTGSITDTAYSTLSGTSMASPNATGSAALLIDQYKRLFNGAMRASTLKGLLIHTATDIGNPGPDYKYGWGLIDTKQAVDLIIDHHSNPAKTRIIEDLVSTGVSTRTYSFLWNGGSPLRATLCWTDPQGASTSAHDSRTRRLVNNLDLKLIAPNGNEYFPFIMPFVGTWTVASMNLNASTGVNNTDNVEQALIQNPGQIGTWQAVVSYSGSLTNGSQAYGLLLSGTADIPNTVNLISPNGGEVFYREVSQNISWTSNVSGNVSIELLKGGSLYSVLSANESNDGSFTWTVPANLPPASDYTLRIASVNNPSYADTSSAPFTIAVSPWALALDTSGITWTSSVNAPWFSQSTTTKDGIDAAQSAAIGDNGSSSLSGTIIGPGNLSFWWKVSSETNYDFLRFFINGVEQTGPLGKISGNVNWVQKSVSLPAGPSTIQWTYSKDFSIASLSDAAWVDQVVFTPPAVPEIVVEQPVGNFLTDGNAVVDCGQANLSASTGPLVFTITNSGNGNLSGLALSKEGAHGTDFILGSLGATTLAPGATTTFTVTFAPSAVGLRTAGVLLTSNDADENPFNISLTGTGIAEGALVVTPAENQTSSGSFGGPFSPALFQYTLANSGTSPLDWTASKSATWVQLNSTGGTLAPGETTTVNGVIQSNANALPSGAYTDTLVFTNTTNGNGSTTRGLALNVAPIPATVTLSSLNQSYDSFQKSVIATTVPPGLDVQVTYNGSADPPVNAGSYSVVATITAPNYSGSDSQTFTISQASQSISFGALSPISDDQASYTPGATATSGLVVSYGSSNTAVASVSGGVLNIVGVGNTVITANQPGNVNFTAAAPVAQTLTVVRANPLAVAGNAYKLLVNQSLLLNGGASEPSYGESITTYEWDLNDDGNFSDATGATPSGIDFNMLTSTWGMAAGVNPIFLKVTDSANKVSIVSTTVQLVFSLTWDANGTTAGQTNGPGIWLDANQWWDGTANQTWASGSSAIFGGPNTAGGVVSLTGPTNVNALSFSAFSGTYTFGSSIHPIGLSGGITLNSGAGAVTLFNPLNLASSQAWTNNSLGLLTIATSAEQTGNGLITVGGSGNTVISGILSGPGGLTKTGTGMLTLSGDNTHGGDTTLTAGTLTIGHDNALGTGSIQLNGGTLSPLDSGGFNLSNAVFLNGNVTIGGAGFLNFYNSDPSVLTGSRTITVNSSGRAVFRQSFSGSGVSINKAGNGTLVLSGTNTYTGQTSILGGTLALGASHVLPDSSPVLIGNANLEVGAGFTDTTGTLDITGVASIELGSGAALEFSSSVGTWAGTLNILGNFVSGASLRFGTDSNGLNPDQLAKISVVGSGPLILDNNGFLTVGATVPNLMGLTQQAAETNIIASGLTVGVVTSQNNLTVPLGTVISQNPGNGTNVALNSAVDFVVSLGPPTYTVSYHPNGAASGITPADQTKTHDIPLMLSTNSGNLTRIGYSFVSWNTAADGSGTDYVEGASYTANMPAVLFAKWILNPVAIITHVDQLVIPEGSSDTFRVKLSAEPTGNVIVLVSVSGGDADLTVQSGAVLTFTLADWNVDQWVTVAAGEDNDDVVAGTATVTCSGVGITSATVSVSESDDDHSIFVSAPHGSVAQDPGTAYHDRDSIVQLTAIPETGYHFVSWGGEVSGSENPVMLTMTSDKSITANFEANALTLGIDAIEVSESAGANATMAKVTRNSPTTGALTVTLSSSDPGEVSLPGFVEIPEGQSSVTFAIETIDDSVVDGSQAVTITATAIHHAPGAAGIQINDDDMPNLTLSISTDVISEGAGAAAGTSTVSRNTSNLYALTVLLVSSDPTELSVPASVTIPEGQDSVSFFFDAVDDSTADGDQIATITASASGHANGSDNLAVLDDDPFTYTISYDGNGHTSGSVPQNQTKIEGVGLSLNTNVGGLARTDFLFSGWNTLPDATGTDYPEGASYGADVAITLYAKWIPKLTPTVNSWPTAANIQVGQPLSAATLNGGTATVAGSFTYNNPSFIPIAGIYSALVTFTPTDTTSYRNVEGPVEVGVLTAFEIWAAGGTTFNGDSNQDGVSDGLAWLLGAADKDQNAVSKLPVPSHREGDLVLEFSCLKQTGRGTTVMKLQFSNDLGFSDAWSSHEAILPDDSGGTVNGVVFVIRANANPELVDVEATIPASAATTGNMLYSRLLAIP